MSLKSWDLVTLDLALVHVWHITSEFLAKLGGEMNPFISILLFLFLSFLFLRIKASSNIKGGAGEALQLRLHLKWYEPNDLVWPQNSNDWFWLLGKKIVSYSRQNLKVGLHVFNKRDN